MSHLLLSRDLTPGANTATGGAGSNTGVPPLLDYVGGIWQTQSGKFVGVTNSGHGFQTWLLIPSGEVAGPDGEVLIDIPAGFSSSATWIAVGRLQSDQSCYLAACGTTVVDILYVNAAGAVVTTIASLALPGLVVRDPTHAYQLSLTIAANALTPGSTLTAVLTDVTAGTSVTLTGTDVSISAAGRWGVSSNQVAVAYSRIRIWKEVFITPDLAEIEASPSGGVETVVTLTGTNTAFDGTSNVVLAGGVGASIVSQTQVSATEIQVTINSGTEDLAVLTLTESTSGESCAVTARYPYLTFDTSYLAPLTAGQVRNVTGKFVLDWTTHAPLFAVSGVSGCSVDSTTVNSATTATVHLTTDGANGLLLMTEQTKAGKGTLNVQQRLFMDGANVSASPGWVSEPTTDGNGLRTNMPGQYVRMRVSSANGALHLDRANLTGQSDGNCPYVEWCVDDGVVTKQQVIASLSRIVLWTNLPGDHTVTLWYQRNPANLDPWTASYTPSGVSWAVPVASVRLDWLEVDPGSTLETLQNPAVRPLRMLGLGDSIMEGSTIIDASTYEARESWLPHVADSLGYEYDQVGFGGQGFTHVGYSVVPVFHQVGDQTQQTWRYQWAGRARDLTRYDLIVVNHGTNDRFSTDAAIEASVQDFLTQLRAAAPQAVIVLVVSFGHWAQNALTTAFNTYQAQSPDRHALLLDAGSEFARALSGSGASKWSVDGLHPNLWAAGRLGAVVTDLVRTQVLGVPSPTPPPAVGGGVSPAIAGVR